MRISDWSSDVCSSDLVWAVEIGRAAMNSSVFEIVTQEYAGLGDRCSELDLQQARRALALLKTAIGPEGIMELLGTQLEEGKEFWRKVLTVLNGVLVSADPKSVV